MPDLKRIKSRIKTIHSTKKITKAMHLISASRMNRARNLLKNAKPYVESFREMVQSFDGANTQEEICIVITSDRGMCGSFNSSIIKLAVSELSQNKIKTAICIGKKGYFYLKNLFKDITFYYQDFPKNLDISSATSIADWVFNNVEKSIKIIYSKFISVIKSEPSILKICGPFIDGKSSVSIEPNSIRKDLYTDYIIAEIYSALAENLVSEHSTRMTVMDNASRNSLKLLKELTTLYNRKRQAMVTKELIEVVSGAEAMVS